MAPTVGGRIKVSGGYDFEPEWLGNRSEVTGVIAKWIPGQNTQPACVILLDEALTATGLVRGKRESRTGSHLVLELRYAGQVWSSSGTVHVELCEKEPEGKPWADREVGAWVESHATYTVLAQHLPAGTGGRTLIGMTEHRFGLPIMWVGRA